MSNSHVDERIVRMQFDNEQFETRARNTISILGSLSEALQFKSGGKGFEQIQNAASRIDFSRLSDAVDLVNYRFSSFGASALGVLDRVANAAIDTGKRLATAVTITPLKEGFSEYELKMESVKRILNSAKDQNGLPVTLDMVNQKLDELNHYADKTIYSFSDMTTNIGKFTNAGVDLDTSVAAIQGIANEAALAGANSQEASRAMYNFAQALSAGYVKLIDWKSIENANMATVGFKDELIKTALELGTIKKKGDDYVTTTKDLNGKTSEAFNSTKLFNESLSHQWMTSEVLTKTLAKYADETTEIGKAAAQAATEVTTFHKLLDTLKEALGSGWAQTWEIIVGDFEGAKKFWTSINNVLSGLINDSADARNKLLEGWVSLGGRAAAIEGLKDVWGGLVNIVREAGWAFEKVLPAFDAFDLTRWSVHVREFGKAFRQFTGRESGNINKTFMGLAAVADLFLQALSAISRSLKPLFGPINQFTHSIFGTVGSFGEWLAALASTARETDFFYNKIQSLIGIFDRVKTAIENAINKVLDFIGIKDDLENGEFKFPNFFELFANKERLSLFARAASLLGRLRDSLINLFNSVKDSAGFATFSQGLSTIVNVLSTFAKAVGGFVLNALKQIGQAIGDFFEQIENADFDQFVDVFNLGLLTALTIGLKKLSDGLKNNPFDALKAFFGNAKTFKEMGKNAAKEMEEFFDTLLGPLKELQASLKADVLIKIALAIAILAASAIALSAVDSDKLTKALIAIAGLMGELATAMSVLSKTLSVGGAAGLGAAGAAMVAMSIAVGILSLAVRNLANLDTDAMWNAIIAVGLLIAAIGALSKFGGRSFKAKGLLSMSVAILIMQIAIRRLSELDEDALKKGVLAVGALMILMGAISKFGGKKFSGFSMVAMATAIIILRNAVEDLGGMDEKSLRNGVLAVGALILFLGAISRLGGKKVSGIGLIAISAAILILKKVVVELGGLEEDNLKRGLIAVGVLTALMIALTNLGRRKVSGIGLIAISAAILILKKVAVDLGTLRPNAMKRGLIAVGILTALMIALTNLGQSRLGAAMSMLIMAGALNALVPVISSLGSLPIKVIALGIGAIAAAFAVLFVAGAAMKPVIGTLLALSGVFALMGVGMTAFGVGLAIAAAAFAAFGASLVLNVGLCADAMIVFVKKIGEKAETLIDVFVQIGTAIIDAIVALAPKIGEAVVFLLLGIMQLVTQYAPLLMQMFVTMTITLIDGIAMAIYNNTDKLVLACRHVVGAIADVVLALLQELLRGIPGVGGKIESEIGKLREAISTQMSMEQGISDGSQYPMGLATGASSVSGLMTATGSSLGDDLKTGISSAWSTLSPELQETLKSNITNGIDGATPEALLEANALGFDLDSALGEGMASGLGDVSTAASAIPDTASSALGDFTEEFRQNGIDLSSAFADGLTGDPGAVQASTQEIGDLSLYGLEEYQTDFEDAGIDSSDSYVDGIESGNDDAQYAGNVLGGNALSGIESVTGFYEAGRDSGFGYIDGLRSTAGDMASAAASVVGDALEAAREEIDSHSPSRKYEKLGSDSDEGYILGVKAKSKSVNNAMRTLATNAMQTFYDGISRAHDLATNDYIVTPTISPIMDMNNIYGGVDYLSNLFTGAGGVLGTIKADINGNVEDIAALKETTANILTALKRARPITIDGKTVIGWVDRGLGAYR